MYKHFIVQKYTIWLNIPQIDLDGASEDERIKRDFSHQMLYLLTGAHLFM